ncbi:MAG: stage II sporulation protein P [Dethiobacter sp.]|nr:stage II sporulation protein P [Dethiobacter sp.]MBS3983557.1 stage II sporulation protein P [Dethiobacter sp.]MCL4464266.1 stage II sporulation protein P [Bacillota bacterium]MCL5993297.1 stage II sporulation protein P [Bacillota bacterium]
MAKSAFFRIRSKKYSERNRKKRRSYLILVSVLGLALALAVLATRSPGFFAQPVLSAITGSAALVEVRPFWGSALYLRILAQVIPGFKETVPQEAVGDVGLVEDGFIKAGGFTDPRDPKHILATQIPFMVDANLQAPAIVQQVGTEQSSEEQVSEEAQVIFPVQRPLTGEGKVLIYHVHTTESFVPTSGLKFTQNLELTVAQLGETLANVLRTEHGLPVLHDQTIHDLPRSTAYQVALPTIKSLLAANPNARLVIDLHRDGVTRNVSTTQLDGKEAGRVMFVVGSRHPNWQQNYQKAMFLHQRLEELAPGISRGVRERPLVYNQHIHQGALLIEVGGHENSLAEALRVIPHLARALADLYNSGI